MRFALIKSSLFLVTLYFFSCSQSNKLENISGKKFAGIIYYKDYGSKSYGSAEFSGDTLILYYHYFEGKTRGLRDPFIILSGKFEDGMIIPEVFPPNVDTSKKNGWAKIDFKNDTIRIFNPDSTFYFIGYSDPSISFCGETDSAHKSGKNRDLFRNSEKRLLLFNSLNEDITTNFAKYYNSLNDGKTGLINCLLNADYLGCYLNDNPTRIFKTPKASEGETCLYIFRDSLSISKNETLQNPQFSIIVNALNSNEPIVVKESIKTVTYTGNRFNDGGLTRSQVGATYDYGNYSATKKINQLEIFFYDPNLDKLVSTDFGYLKNELNNVWEPYNFNLNTIIEYRNERERTLNFQLIKKVCDFIDNVNNNYLGVGFYRLQGGRYVYIFN